MKKAREGYKMTEFGEIPSEWEIKKLEELITIKHGYAFKGEYITDNETNSILVTPVNFRLGGGFLETKIKYYKDNIDVDKDYILDNNDIIVTMTDLSKDGGTLGYPALIPNDDKIYLHNQRIGKINIENKIVKKEFLFRLLCSERYRRYILSTASGTTVNHTSPSRILEYNAIIPTIYEQEKIASILSTVDEQIDNIDALIEKNKELKKGLMQTLLTKGIGHTKFKKTEVGEIPEEWKVKKLGDICEVKGGKRLPKGYQLEDEDNTFPYIRVADMYMGGIRQDNIKYVPKDIVDKIKIYKISKDDLFISVAGTLGIVGQVPDELNGANLTENADKLCNIQINKVYLMKVLQSNIIQSIIESEQTKSAQPKLALTRIKDFLIPVPNDREQVKIAAILVEVDEKIEKYQNKKQRLEELKKGLVQQLLTGKIRVV